MKPSRNCWIVWGCVWKCAENFRTRPLIEYLRTVPDPRCGRAVKHDHAEVLLCLICGFLAGRCTIRRSLDWCRNHLEELRKYTPLRNGIASPATACRILSGTDEELFRLAFMEWIGEIVSTKDAHLAIDGKALRAAASKVTGGKVPMILNVVETGTGLVAAQLPIAEKACEITEIPKLLQLLNIQGSTITIDAIGTQTQIMEQILEQEGHFLLMVKKNQPQSYEEIMKYMEEMAADHEKGKKDQEYRPRYPELQECYSELSSDEKNRERHEHRCCRTCTNPSLLTKTQEEWPFIKTVGQILQVRVLMERDERGDDVTPDWKDFLKRGSRRRPKPESGDNEQSDIQKIGVISDRELKPEEMLDIRRAHWTVENRLHHVLDDTFREDRSPAGKSRNNLALIRKYAYNILRLAMLSGTCSRRVMTEAMDAFCDDRSLMEKYVFNGIISLY